VTVAHLCVEGTKGAGKSTTIASVRQALEAEGWVVETHALFHDGNAWAREQGFEGGVPMMESTAEANERIARWLVAREDAVREDFFARHQGRAQSALLLSDRGWITLHAYLYEGAWAREPSRRPEIDALWAERVRRAPTTVFIHTPPEVTAARRKGALDAVSGLQSDARLRADYERRMRLALAHADRVARRWETGVGPFVDLAPAVLALVRGAR
jgi:thymidylate kinase